MGTRSLLKTKVFCNKGYDVIVSVYDINKNILSRNSNCIVDVAIWPKFGNACIPMNFLRILKEIYKNCITIWPKKWIFLRVVLVQIQLLAIDMALKFYSSAPKGLKLKLRKFWGLIPTFGEVTGEKWSGGLFCTHLPHPG